MPVDDDDDDEIDVQVSQIGFSTDSLFMSLSHCAYSHVYLYIPLSKSEMEYNVIKLWSVDIVRTQRKYLHISAVQKQILFSHMLSLATAHSSITVMTVFKQFHFH